MFGPSVQPLHGQLFVQPYVVKKRVASLIYRSSFGSNSLTHILAIRVFPDTSEQPAKSDSVNFRFDFLSFQFSVSFQIQKSKFEETNHCNIMRIGIHDHKCFLYIVSEAFFKKLISSAKMLCSNVHEAPILLVTQAKIH